MSVAVSIANSTSSTLAHSLAEAEASSRAEGVDTTNDLDYQAAKAKLLAGEIDSDQAVALYATTIKGSSDTK